jgi:predicted phosphoribosyltransferase
VEPIVLAVPRGGVPLGAFMAHALGCPLDMWLGREVPVPYHREHALGGLGEGGTLVLDDAAATELSPILVHEAVQRERAMLAHDIARFRTYRAPAIAGATAIVVDEAIETPWRVLAIVRDLVARGARKCVVATPIITPAAAVALQHDAADIACVVMALDPAQLRAWRTALPLVTDAEIQLATEYASYVVA